MKIRYRLTHRLRLSRSFGHFWKWRHGDGASCPWCALCRRFPPARRLIPYSETNDG